MLIGYARCSTDGQDTALQQARLVALGVEQQNIYVDHGVSATRRDRPGLDRALGACREGDRLVVTALDRLARSVIDYARITEDLNARGASLSLDGQVHDPADPMTRAMHTMLALLAEFELSMIRRRTCEGMAVAKAAGRLKGGTPKLSPAQRAHLLKLHATGAYTVRQLGELLSVSRSTVFRELARAKQDPLATRTDQGPGPMGTLALAYEDA